MQGGQRQSEGQVVQERAGGRALSTARIRRPQQRRGRELRRHEGPWGDARAEVRQEGPEQGGQRHMPQVFDTREPAPEPLGDEGETVPEQIRVVEGLGDEDLIDEADCPVCEGGTDVTQYYPRMGRGEGDGDMASGGLAKQIIPLTPDLQGVIKTSVVSALSIAANDYASEKLIGVVFKNGLPEGFAGVVTEAAIEAGMAAVAGGLVVKFTGKRALGTAWALGPMTLAASTVVTNLIGRAKTDVTGLRSVGAPIAALEARPANVRLPYTGSQNVLNFRNRAASGF